MVPPIYSSKWNMLCTRGKSTVGYVDLTEYLVYRSTKYVNLQKYFKLSNTVNTEQELDIRCR